jgi:hypothetical protein
MTLLHLITFVLSITTALTVAVVVFERQKRRGLQAALRRSLRKRSRHDWQDDP